MGENVLKEMILSIMIWQKIVKDCYNWPFLAKDNKWTSLSDKNSIYYMRHNSVVDFSRLDDIWLWYNVEFLLVYNFWGYNFCVNNKIFVNSREWQSQEYFFCMQLMYFKGKVSDCNPTHVLLNPANVSFLLRFASILVCVCSEKKKIWFSYIALAL